MDLDDFKPFDGERLIARIRALPRAELDALIRTFGAQYSLLCQRLEALYSPDRLDQFIAIRPGGLSEIDGAIRKAEAAGAQKELSLLKPFRELNRVLVPFMDVYEEMALTDLKHMSQEELETILKVATDQLKAVNQTLAQKAGDYRAEQNSAGTLRLMMLMQDVARRELQERFGSGLE